MKILIIGNGAREYSIGLSLKQDQRINKLYFYPGNGGTHLLGENVQVSSYDELIYVAKELNISLVVIGPEAPLVEGVGDLFEEAGFSVFGPSAKAAILEGSKAFMKEFAKRHKLPTARFIQTTLQQEAMSFIAKIGYPVVIKADGLCAGKGVIIAQDQQDAEVALQGMLKDGQFGKAGECVVVEEFLDGFELSVFAVCDGETHILLPAVQDHKRLLSGNVGPNTGGMGAYAPTPLATKEIIQKIQERIVKPTLKGMSDEGRGFKGVLFCGIMVVDNEPYLLEFNVRFGDPECEVLLPLLKTPLLDILLASTRGELGKLSVEFLDSYCLAVILASKNYPYTNSPNAIIHISKDYMQTLQSHFCFAGVERQGEELLATGGRVIACVSVGETLKEAQLGAYKLCQMATFEGMQFRDDIGLLALMR
ncbi:phosphoribosylamine--glycine ligase [Helicobacter monodelphidis]|uniref:phosphoribosylamine--glycine ligase n=1 Tax=Helicobacter sp. 15-1451 TaxID=2004995 RepID=UPI000DCE88DE|nr:phosphoribosylamine--glycine ligase [Helicobacter sp. 15-1451]RAX58832.1 phosphoribosylamine--glycine ligase [Helicobacter sp. 15-1451]